ncbi:protein export chaperone SecB [Gammaproteobacteria bacterium]
MSNENTQGPEGQFLIQKLYVKDLSFETPNSPIIFMDPRRPEVNVQLDSSARRLDSQSFEVVLSITVTVKMEERTAYLAEVNQAGIFTLSGIPEQHMDQMLGAFCPTILFPYAREVISDLAIRGGFSPLLLAPVNFDAIYLQRVQQQQTSSTQA